MSLPNRLILPVILSTLAVLAGCGSGTHHVVPPPTGGYNNANFSGTYAFSTNGTDVDGAPIAIAGTIAADGTGHITGGAVDVNDAQFDPAVGVAVTGGSYSVTADGRGKASITASTPLGNSFGVVFVLTSNTHGLITHFDGNGSGSGSMDLQSTVTQAQLAGSYAFTLSGIDPAGNLPFGTIGSFTLGSDGTITNGVEDFDDVGFAYTAFALNGSVVAQGSGAPFVATLTATNTSDVAVFGTMTFDVYPVDATHLKLIETDSFQQGFGLLSGDAFTQTGASIPSTATNYVFTMGGGVQGTGPITAGGVIPIDGAGNIPSGTLDINVAGTILQLQSFAGEYGTSGSSVGGRTLFHFDNGFQVAHDFYAYPTAHAGLLMLEMDGGGTGFLQGSALPQTGTTLAASQGYGMNLSGVNTTSEEDDIAEFTTTSTGFSGLIDFNDQGSTASGQSLTGTYAADEPPAGRYDVLSNGFNGELYAVDGSTALFVELDTTQVGIGTIQLQAATTSAAAASRLVVPARTVLPRAAKNQNAAQWRHAPHQLHK